MFWPAHRGGSPPLKNNTLLGKRNLFPNSRKEAPNSVGGAIRYCTICHGNGEVQEDDESDEDADDEDDDDGDDDDGDGHVDKEEEDDDDDAEEKNPSQDRDAHFTRAGAIEMHIDRVQESQEPFCKEFYKKNAGRQSRGHRFVRACTVEMHMDIWEEPFCGN